MSDFPGDDLLAEIAELWAQITERDDAIAELRAQVAERDATILSLRALRAERDAFIAQVTKILGGYPDSDLLSLATTVAAGYERWNDGYDAQVEALRLQLAERDTVIAEIIGDDNLENQYLFQIAELRGRVAKHKATIAERDATITDLRAQVATLTERLSRCTCTDDYGDVAE